jgi:hypothetical protein
MATNESVGKKRLNQTKILVIEKTHILCFKINPSNDLSIFPTQVIIEPEPLALSNVAPCKPSIVEPISLGCCLKEVDGEEA